jgi:tryptophan synthase alpha subunit
VDAVLVLDLPVEEASGLRGLLSRAGLDMIFLLSPTTSDRRLARACDLGSGFLYAISRLGVTGARDSLPEGAERLVRRIRARSRLPVALGFGISRPEHVRQVGEWADAAVVGSGLVSVIEAASGGTDLASRVADVNNAGSSGFAGAITAALFLRRFVTDPSRWLHVDLYGWNAKERPGRPVGAEGQCIRALYGLIRQRFG